MNSIIKARDVSVLPCKLPEVREFVETNHYSHSVNGVKISHCFRVEHEGLLIGAVIFGQLSTTAWKKFSDQEQKVIELRRLVLTDQAGRNSESRVIGKCLKWLAKNDKKLEVVVSYADPAHGHTGIIYRASNFQYWGETPKDTGFFDLETGKTYHSRAMRTRYKGEYKPFVLRLREKLAQGLLHPVVLPGKHCYVYPLKRSKKNMLNRQ